MKKLENKVAFITGAARGQGRSHAVKMAEHGARIVALDICAQIPSVPSPLSTPEDLAETVALVEATGQKALGIQADVRDAQAMQSAVADALTHFGSIDIVVANAGIAPMSMNPKPEEWHDVIDVNLTGVYNTVTAARGSMVERGAGGSIIIISSTAGLVGIGSDQPGGLAYTASKTGLVGLMRAWSNYLAPHDIRVNTIHPTAVKTPMIMNEWIMDWIENERSVGDRGGNSLPVDAIEPEDVSNAVLWLASDDARYVTGVALPVDAGCTNRR